MRNIGYARVQSGAKSRPTGDKPYTSGVSKYWQKTKCEHWRRQNQNRYKLLERPKPAAPTERERAVHRKKIELARIQERLAERALRAGMKAALKAQEMALALEIAELEAERRS
jgi:hypothetical protein